MIRGGATSPRVIIQGGIEKKMEGKENDEEGGLRLRRQCAQRRAEGAIICDERLGGMLRYYRRAA